MHRVHAWCAWLLGPGKERCGRAAVAPRALLALLMRHGMTWFKLMRVCVFTHACMHLWMCLLACRQPGHWPAKGLAIHRRLQRRHPRARRRRHDHLAAPHMVSHASMHAWCRLWSRDAPSSASEEAACLCSCGFFFSRDGCSTCPMGTCIEQGGPIRGPAQVCAQAPCAGAFWALLPPSPLPHGLPHSCMHAGSA